MKTRSTPTFFGLSCALALAVSACGKKNDDAAGTDRPGGAQSTYGKMLESAKDTAERANEHSEKLKEIADPSGE